MPSPCFDTYSQITIQMVSEVQNLWPSPARQSEKVKQVSLQHGRKQQITGWDIERQNKLEHQVQGESLTTHDRPVVSYGTQYRLPKLLPNQSGVKKNNVVHWEKLSLPFSILPLTWKCLTALIKLLPLQRKQISLAAARLKVASSILFLLLNPFLGLSKTAAYGQLFGCEIHASRRPRLHRECNRLKHATSQQN